MFFNVIVLILFFAFDSGVESAGLPETRSDTDTRGCKTTSDGPQVNVPCVFPFLFKGIEYNECIFESGDDTPWCSTKVDENGKHVSGQDQWGHCEESCPVDGLKDCRTTGIGGGKKNAECIFPFIYKGVRYSKCLWAEGESDPWCSTKVTKHGFHVGGQGEWGHCNSNCPISPKPDKDVTTEIPEEEDNEIDGEEQSATLSDKELQENEENNRDDIRNMDIEKGLEEYYGEDEYQMYDDEHLPDLTKPIDRIAASSDADYSSGSSGVSEIKIHGKKGCKRKCLQYKRVRKDGILGNLVWKCVKKGCQGPSRDR